MLTKDNFSLIGLILGLLVFLVFYIQPHPESLYIQPHPESLYIQPHPDSLYIQPHPESLSRVAWLTAGVAILMTIWWVSEAVPIYITGLVPLVAFPLLGLFDLKIVANSYAHPLVLLFLGGFIIASAMESSGLHKRIALSILSFSGTSPSKIIAGFMTTTALLSMWVSNTASTIMMLPIASSVILIFSRQNNIKDQSFAIPLLLSIAYSASIGGTATLIGTPTNIMLATILSDTYDYQISFIDWFIIGFPVVIILIPIAWFFLSKIIFKVSSVKSLALEKTITQLKLESGKITFAEKVVAIVFVLTASLWIFRKLLNDTFNTSLNDTSIGLLGALLLFVIPTGKNERACSWKTASKIPWGVLFLVGGGIALSGAFKSSGLAVWIGSYSNYLYSLNIYLLILISVALIIFLTELNSNTATVATFTPVLIVFAAGLNINPLYLVIPTTIAASCAFMLPVATPPNAVIFGSGKVSVNSMVKAGASLNLVAMLVVTLVSFVILNQIFDQEIHVLPDWIK